MGVEEILKKKKSGNQRVQPTSGKKKNLEIIQKRLTGWQLESFKESYTYKIENGISLFKKKLLDE